MKKLILLLLLTASNLCGEKIHNVIRYKSIPVQCYVSDALIQSALITAAWSAKFTTYNFELFDFHYIVVLKASNSNCMIYVRFNRKTHDCVVEFIAYDKSFDYDAFKNIMDSFFMWKSTVDRL